MIDFFNIALPGMAAMLCLILASGFFSASETALFYLSHDDLRSLRVGKPRQRAVATLLSDPDRLLTGVLFWNLVINLVYFATGVVISQQLIDEGHTAAAAAFSIAALFTIILFGEVLPKSMAVVFRRRLSTLVSWPLAAALRVLDPVTPSLQRVSVLARRTFWPHIKREPYLESEDLERAVEATEQGDEVIRLERQVLHNILDLSEIRVEEVMRPRGTYVSLSPPVSRDALEGNVPPSDYLTIHEAATEEVTGAVPLSTFTTIPFDNLEAAAEEVVHVPWCADVAHVLQLLRENFLSVANVVNEYGETVGIVTYEDILDTVLMPDPSRAKRLLKREPVQEIAKGRYEVEGITTLRYLCRKLDIPYTPTSEGLVTLAGMFYEKLEHIPEPGDECRWQGYLLKVIDVSKRGQMKVIVSQELPEGGRS